MKKVLGLDLGTNSIGWALVNLDDIGTAVSIEATGVRIFQEAVDPKTRVPKNQQRRAARALRRVLARRRRRKAKLRRLLCRVDMLPPGLLETARPEEILNAIGDPYLLRARALDERLTLHEMGRVLLHLCARRGFQSNRKSLFGMLADEFDDLIEAAENHGLTQSADAPSRRKAKDEEGQVKNAISQLRQEIKQSGARTLGEYLATVRPPERKRGRYTDRAMFKDEFEEIWKTQSGFHSALCDDGLRASVFNAIFYQRPLKSAKALVGRCSLERTRKRAAVARLESQEFRILQDVNHLAVRDPKTRLYNDLSHEQQLKLIAALQGQKTMSWGAARKLLGLHKGETFNLEDGGRDKLRGNTTGVELSRVLGKRWTEFSAEDKSSLLEDLLTIEDKRHLVRRLREHWRLPREEQYALATLELEPGYLSHSVKAIGKLLPALRAGAKYHEARQAAGYGYDEETVRAVSRLPPPGLLRNPVVEKAMVETRKVINHLVAAFGCPEIIRVEMARDLKLSSRQKDALIKQQRLNEKANDRARDQLQGLGIAQPTRDDLLKFRLWEECKGECPYTGRVISMHQLFSPEIDIEHIVPYPRCLDDSYMNKTLCLASENRAVKRGQTPWEAYGSSAERWEQMLQRIKEWPIAKQRRFTACEIESVDEFISRQLNDTRYIAVEVKNYLQKLGADVQVSKGAITADLRRIWGLNVLLGYDPEKKQRTDHRHHALDAIVIALAGRSVYQKLASRSESGGQISLRHGRLALPEPWKSFKDDVAASLDSIVVSHAPNRKIQGAFHEATAYGFRESTGKYHYRKRLDPLFSPKSIDDIADAVVRELVRQRLDEHGGDAKKAFKEPLFHKDGVTPIRSVRLAKAAAPQSVFPVAGADGVPFKYYDLGNNHHIAIFEDQRTGRRSGVVVSAIEAARRARRAAEPVVQRTSEPGKRFVMSLIINDMVQVDGNNGPVYYRVQKISNDTEITLREHRAATLDNNHERLRSRPNTLRGQKVNVDPIGRVSIARD